MTEDFAYSVALETIPAAVTPPDVEREMSQDQFPQIELSNGSDGIKGSYRRLAKKFHPYCPGGNKGAFQALSEAYFEMCKIQENCYPVHDFVLDFSKNMKNKLTD